MPFWNWFSAVLAIAITGGLAWWLRRKAAEVDEYYEREYKDPSQIGDWGGGGPY